jgi:hypothetical protein
MKWLTIVAVCLMSTVAWGANHKWEDPLPHKYDITQLEDCARTHDGKLKIQCNGYVCECGVANPNCGMACNGIIPKPKLPEKLDCYWVHNDIDSGEMDCILTDWQIKNKINEIIDYLEEKNGTRTH